MQIEEGPFKGFYKFNVNFSSGPSIIYDKNQPFMKWKSDAEIRGFNRILFPFVNGFYYIPKSMEIDQIDLRRFLYALENSVVPSSGNVETFEEQLRKLNVPSNYCPALDPCPYQWCVCQQGFPPEPKKLAIFDLNLTMERLFIFIGVTIFLIIIIYLAFNY